MKQLCAALCLMLALCGCAAARDEWNDEFVGTAASAEDTAQPADAPKLVALTFDDGPGKFTEELLDGLLERNARATFFLIGNKIDDANAPLVVRMANEGHCVANHTHSHQRLHLLSNEEVWREIEQADNVIQSLTGVRPPLIRPPYGNFTSRVQALADRPFILWSVDPEDWREELNARTVYEKIVNNTVDGDIILLHELSRSSVQAALDAVDELQGSGFQFVTIPELFDAKGLELAAGSYYWAANQKEVWNNPITEYDDPYLY